MPQIRLHKSENDEGDRTPFERDRDAILYCSAFSRLAGVTQVVSPGEGQIYHNRLTHSLKVAQVARSIANKFRVKQKDLADSLNLVPAVPEAAALAHDLGHPPFGHIAEKELNKLLLANGVTDGYEGNAQSFRIVSKLAVRVEDESKPGLNLTRAVLNAILKYPKLQKPGESEKTQAEKKWGAYQSEIKEFEFARKNNSENSFRSLEAQIMDWADDITYSIHDTEDFFRAGLIPLNEFSSNPKFVSKFLNNAFENISKKGDLNNFNKDDLTKVFEEFCQRLPFETPYYPTRKQRAIIRNFTSINIGLCIDNTKLKDKIDENGEWLEIPKDIKMTIEILKEFTWQFVIKRPSLAITQYGQKKALKTLFDVYSDAASSKGNWAILPDECREKVEKIYSQSSNPEKTDILRVVADTIAGMTDQQVLMLYQRIIGIKNGSSIEVFHL